MIRTFLFFSWSAFVMGADLSLDGIAARVRNHNPVLKAARLAVDEARGRQLGSGRLPNPTFESSFQNESRVSPSVLQFGLDQSFPITNRLKLEKQLSRELVAAAELEVRDVERRLIAEARVGAVRIAAIDQQRILRQQQREIARKLSEFAKGRAEKGELSPLDAGQAQVDAQRLILELKKLETQRTGLVGALKPMLGISPQDSLVIRGGLPAMVMPVAAAWRTRADFQLAQTKIIAAETAADLAKSKRLQDVSAGFFSAQELQDQSNGQRERTGFVGFRVSIPLPFWNRNEGEIAGMEATAERERLSAEALGQQIAGEADTARREMLANADLVRETRDELLPLVIAQTEKLESAYEAGQSDLLVLLRARDQRLQLEAAVIDALRDFHLAKVRFEAAIGTPQP